MSWIREGWHRVRSLAGRDAIERGLDEEIRFHIDQQTEKNVRAGMTPVEARRQAFIKFGGLERVKENTRDEFRPAFFEDFVRDLRYGARALGRAPGFTAVATLTLALGIGANTAIFSVVNTVLLEPLSYREPDRLVLVWERNTAIGKDRDLVAPPNYLDWKAQNAVFDALGAYRIGGFAFTGAGEPESVTAITVSSSLFRVLGVEPLVGRTFTDEEEARKDRVVVLRHDFWQRRFGGDRSIVGKAITLAGAPFTVVGVMPPSFRFPDGNPGDVYSPLMFSASELSGRRTHSLTVLGRLKDRVTIEAASANMTAIAQGIAAADQGSNPDASVVGAHDLLVEDVRLGLLVLLGTVGFVLLIACANVANLLLVRATARRGEMAMRSALGAGRRRLIRQLLTESALLAVVGGALGVAVAWSALGLLVRVSPPDLPRIDQVGIDTTVLLFVTAVALLAGVGFGVAPALQVSGANLVDATQESRVRRQRGRSALVVAEVALSLVLLAGAGLMIRSFLKLQNLDLGFQAENVLTAQVFLPANRYPVDSLQFRPTPPGVTPQLSKPSAFYALLMEKLAATPGLESAGAVSSLPLNPVGIDYDLPVIVQGRPRPRVGEEPQADFRMATPDYFRTMHIGLKQGRLFTEFDGPEAAPVVIVNETMATQMFGGENPVGQRLLLYGKAREIVGVVASVKHHGFSRDARPEMVVPSRQFQLGGMTIVARSQLDPSVLGAAITREVHAIDPELPVSRVRTMEEFRSASVAQPRFTALLLASFALLAVSLALVGVYGVMAYAVSQRTREIGVRMALGAERPDVVWMVVRHGVTLAGLGIVIGLLGAAAGTRLMERLLFGVSATDPMTFVAAAVALGIASVAATFIPALRAARVAPVTALRCE
ncbi:ABC transporter permease [Piscinibacter sp.]|uniref:ABC transporter permease n=1 Tax=Piscinibacter sp. TaxID=1903157 RepID=UPI002B798A9F|nr:ABC transporter permease [Albitalea sp.]HUG25365.1 ABC transporter permease [Albitalea sp.]